ncbi:MAG: NAD-dependent epimerase/dehydratase family protein [Bacteroidales bacterium]|jgi:nucleoside-diphosphate-sugar epimerase|nr:NAD-dependent epimerase/dehydratase family protein [Bacteroidales bacterium]
MMQTILGSGGGIGIPLARELMNYTNQIRLVSRNPRKVNNTDELFTADLHDFNLIDKAIAGSEVVYVTIGFDYNLKVWRETWPPFMQEVIYSCIRHNARLVFFDNIYLYSKNSVPFMTEESEVMPPAEKGKVRKIVRDMIINEVEKKNLSALIARGADFYGPENRNSMLNMMAQDMMKGKKARVFGNPDKIHTYTYTPDAARATAILGNTPDAFNQEWHVPTTSERLTTNEWIELIAKELNSETKVQKVPVFMINALGLFIPIMREFPEMLYQFEQDYILDSSKFEKRFGIQATAPSEGIKQMIASLR